MSSPLDIARDLTRTSRSISLRIVMAGTFAALAFSLIPLGMLDYSFRFNRSARCVLAVIMIASAVAAWRKLIHRFRPLAGETDAASFVERARKNLKSLFLTGVEAEAGRARGDADYTRQVISDAARTIGDDAIGTIDRSPLVRIMRAILLVTAISLVLFALDPDASARHTLRVLFPTAPIDAATSTRIRVDPGDAVVTRGDSLLIRATTTGVLPPDAILLMTDETGLVTRIPMDVARGDTAERIFEARILRVDANFGYEIAAGDARTYPKKITCLVPPSLAGLTLRLQAPAYTGRTAEELLDPGEIRLLRGTRVEVIVTADRALAGARIVLESDTETILPMSHEGSRAEGSFVAEESCTLDIHLDGRDGFFERGASARAHRDIRMIVIEDRPPVLQILSPRRTVKAVATEEIPFDIVAKDDYGLTGINVYVAVAEETEAEWRKLDRRGETAAASFVFPLEEFSLEIGDAVHIRVEGTDAAGGSTSRERMVQITAFERYYRFAHTMPGGIEALMPALKKFIALEQNVITRTTESLGHGPEEMSEASEKQERVRADLHAELQELREVMKTNDPLDRNREVIDQIFNDAEKAADDMARARDRLNGGRGIEGLSSERSALNHLMKAFQSILTLISQSASPKARQMEQALDEQFENLPVDSAPRQAASGERKNSETAQDAKSLMDRAREMMKNGNAAPEDLKNLADDVERMAQGMEGSGSSSGEQAQDGTRTGSSNADSPGTTGSESARDEERRAQGNAGGEERARSGGGTGGEEQRGDARGGREARNENGSAGENRNDRRGGRNGSGGSRNPEDQSGGSASGNRNLDQPGDQGSRDQRNGSQDPGSQQSGNQQSGNQQTGNRSARDERSGPSGSLQPQADEDRPGSMAGGANAPNRRQDRQFAEQLRDLARQIRQASGRNPGGTINAGGSGALVDLLGRLVDLLESIRDTTSARETIAELLEEIENDPDSVPPEMREIVRRYFELLR